MPFLQFNYRYYYITDDEAKFFNTLVIPDKVRSIFSSELVDVDENDFQALLSLIQLNILKAEVHRKYIEKDGSIKTIDSQVVEFVEKYYIQDIDIDAGFSIRTESKPAGDIFALWDCVLNISQMFYFKYDCKTKINSFALDVLKSMIMSYLEPMRLKYAFIFKHPIRGPSIQSY